MAPVSPWGHIGDRLRRAAGLRRGRPRDRGQSLVEMVLVLPILLVLVFGIIEFATAWRAFQLITNVAREGARLSVTPTATDAGVQSRVDELLTSSGLDADAATVTLACEGSPGGLCTTSGQGNEVQIDYPHQFAVLGPLLGLMCSGCGDSGFGTVTLSTRSIMRKE